MSATPLEQGDFYHLVEAEMWELLLISAVNCSWFLCMSAVQGEFGVGECAVL